jgi:hypothetical protein
MPRLHPAGGSPLEFIRLASRLASVVLAVLCVRVFVFEYTHGGQEVVHKLFDFLLS